MSGVATVFVREVSRGVLEAPFWWYTTGAFRAFDRLRTRLRDGNEYLGWSIWVTNLFTPMYAQRDLAGRVISVVVRLVQIAVRTVLFGFWIVICLALFTAYLLLPLLTAAEVVYQWRHVIG